MSMRLEKEKERGIPSIFLFLLIRMMKSIVWAFDEIVPPLIHAFKPDVVVTQLGVDSFYNDPLTNLHLTIYGYEKVLRQDQRSGSPLGGIGGRGI